MTDKGDILLDIDRALDGQRDVELDAMLDTLFGDCNVAGVAWDPDARGVIFFSDPDPRIALMRRFRGADPKNCRDCERVDVLAVEEDGPMGYKPGQVIQTIRECQTIEQTNVMELVALSWASGATRSLVYRAGLGREPLPLQARNLDSLLDVYYLGVDHSDIIDWQR